MKTIHFLRTGFLMAVAMLALNSCITPVTATEGYDMVIYEFSNQRLQDNETLIDVRVNNRGCPPQSFIKADVIKSGNSFTIGIRYKDGEGVSTCATFDQTHAVNLGQLASGSYVVEARAQTEPTLTITIP